MKVELLGHQTFSVSSFGSTSMNPSSSDYASNQSSSFTPQPSRVNPTSFPLAIAEGDDIGKRSTMRRQSKMNLLSKLFSGSRRDLKGPNKSAKDLSKDKSASSHQSTMKSASSPTLDLSRDAAQVFGTLRNKQDVKPRRGLVRQKSDDSMIGSVLEIPSTAPGASEETAANNARIEMATTPPPRPTISARAASVRHMQRPSGFVRAPSTRSVSFQPERPTLAASVTVTSNRVPSPTQHNNMDTPFAGTVVASERIPSPTNSNTQTPPTPRTVEISPGNFQALRGHKETLEYVRKDQVASTTCLCCNDTIYAINDAALVVCPTCRSITPMQDAQDGDGLALGFTAHEWLDIQREALAATTQ